MIQNICSLFKELWLHRIRKYNSFLFHSDWSTICWFVVINEFQIVLSMSLSQDSLLWWKNKQLKDNFSSKMKYIHFPIRHYSGKVHYFITCLSQQVFPGCPHPCWQLGKCTQEHSGHSPPFWFSKYQDSLHFVTSCTINIRSCRELPYLSCISDRQAVQGPNSHMHNLLPSQTLHYLWFPHMHIRAVAQSEIVPLPPARSQQWAF